MSAPHPLVATYPVELDRVRPLRFTLAESADFRRRTGISVLRDGLNLLALDEDQLLHLICAACAWEDPTVTPEQLAPFVSGDKLVVVLAALMSALNDYQPQVPDGDQNPLTASARSLLTTLGTGRSPRRPSESPIPSTGRSHPA